MLPLSGPAHSLTVLCNEDKGWEFFLSDRFGFSNPDPVWDHTTPIVLLGDSFTLGECLSLKDRFASLIQKRMPLTLNLGYSATGPLVALARLVEWAPPNPTHVFYFFYEGNDYYELINEARTPLLKRYLDEASFTQNIREQFDALEPRVRDWHGQRVDSLTPFWKDTAGFFLLTDTLRIISRRVHEPTYPPPNKEQVIGLLKQIFFRFAHEIRKSHSEMTVFYLPEPGRKHAAYFDVVKQLTRKHRMELVDLSPYFAQAHVTLREGYHYPAPANQLIADLVLRRMGVSTSSSFIG